MMKPGVKSMEHGVNGRFSFPLAQLAAGRWQFSARKESGPSGVPTRHSPHATRHFGAAFSLIELLVVVAIIAVLAGLTLATLGYVNKKGAESRARSEVAAIASAIEDFKRDTGSYPKVNDLVGELTINTGKVYFEVLPRHLNAAGKLIDPWGDPYLYATNPAQIQNRGFFDFYSRAGGETDESKWIRN